MANAERGAVGFEASGRSWVLRYTTNSLCELEDHLGKSTNEIAAALQGNGVGMKLLRSVFWGGLIDAHPEVDLKTAGDLMSEVGFGQAGEMISEAFSRAFPAAAGDDARPPKGERAAKAGKPS